MHTRIAIARLRYITYLFLLQGCVSQEGSVLGRDSCSVYDQQHSPYLCGSSISYSRLLSIESSATRGDDWAFGRTS